MKDETGLVANGRPRCDGAGDTRAYAVNPPLERVSTILFPTYADFLDGSAQVRYGRFGASTHRALEASIAALEGGHSTRLAPSGLQAIAAAMLAFIKAGDHVLIADCVYDPTRTFADIFLSRFGVEVEYFAPAIGADLAALMRANTTVVFVESPGSLTFEVQDLPAFAQAADRSGAILIADNTWSAGFYQKPIALGAKVSVQAATKYLSGHSDVMLGAITSADQASAQRVYDSLSQIGAAVSPDDVYLAHRGLRTLAVRLKRSGETGLELAAWLAARPEVARVLHPALSFHTSHALWRRDFSGAPGLFSVVLKPVSEAAIAAFFDALKLFGIGFSWGGYESLAVRVRPERARTIESWTEPGAVIRFHAGLEDAGDLIEDLERAFTAMASVERV